MLQQQGATTAHVGGWSSFSLRNCGMQVEFQARYRRLFGQPDEPMPPLLTDHDWGIGLGYLNPPLLPPGVGLIEYDGGAEGGFPMQVSGDVRALLEILAVAEQQLEFDEAYEILELKQWLQPDEVQPVLEACTDERAARAFLYLAECAEVDWFRQLDVNAINLGGGILDLVENGVLNEKYRLRIPEGLGVHEYPEV